MCFSSSTQMRHWRNSVFISSLCMEGCEYILAHDNPAFITCMQNMNFFKQCKLCSSTILKHVRQFYCNTCSYQYLAETEVRRGDKQMLFTLDPRLPHFTPPWRSKIPHHAPSSPALSPHAALSFLKHGFNPPFTHLQTLDIYYTFILKVTIHIQP